MALGCLVGPLAATAVASTTKTYTTPGSSSFTVPKDVVAISVTATGAAGGNCNFVTGNFGPFVNSVGGEGAQLAATFPVKPGSKLFVGVAGVGGDCAGVLEAGATTTTQPGGTGGAGGGGAGGSAEQFVVSGAGGGGASGVGHTSLAAGTSPLIVAGGGGGAAFCTTNGGNAGSPGSDGSTADNYCNPASPGFGGGAGTSTAGGAGGAGGASGTASGQSGSAGQGGAGGDGSTNIQTPGFEGMGGGGGGGGYFGGGGGGAGGTFFSAGGSGGGGSSFTAADAITATPPAATTASASVKITYTKQPPPVAITHKATGVKSTSATIHGSVNPKGLKTTYYFQYGTSKKYGKSTGKHSLKAGMTAKSVKAMLHGLKPGTTYHFRVLASNAAGKSDGKDMTFTTPKAKVKPAFTG